MWIHGEFSARWLGAAVNNPGMIMAYGAPVVKMEWNESNNYILLYVPSEIKRYWEPNTLFAYVTHIAVSNYLPWLFFLPVYYLYIPLLECKLSVWEEVPFLHSTPENSTVPDTKWKFSRPLIQEGTLERGRGKIGQNSHRGRSSNSCETQRILGSKKV